MCCALIVALVWHFRMAGSGTSLRRFEQGVDLSQAIQEPDTKGELDGWQLFEPGDSFYRLLQNLSLVFVLLLIGLGFLARSRSWLLRANAENLRRLCFNWLLPAFLLRHIWLCQLDSQLYVIAAYSLIFHVFWCFASFRVAIALKLGSRQLTGWAMLMSQGTMNSFIYPLLLSRDRFGEKALACAVLWDLGGNMWICQFALFAIAARFGPLAEGDLEDKLDSRKDTIQLGIVGDEADEEETESLLSEKIFTMAGQDGNPSKDHPDSSFLASLASLMPRRVLLDALRQPVLRCCILGFLLNRAGIPLPSMADNALWVVGEPYKIVLYFLIGFYGDHQISAQDMSLLVRCLGARYAISVVIIGLVALCLPVDLMYRQTLVLVALSPSSSYLIHLVAEHGYGESLLRLTVCGGFLCTIISTFAQNLLIGVFDSS